MLTQLRERSSDCPDPPHRKRECQKSTAQPHYHKRGHQRMSENHLKEDKHKDIHSEH